MATIFVSTSGNDTTGNGTQALPYRTPAKGISLANPGDTVFIRGGTYSGAGLNSSTAVKGSGTALGWIDITRTGSASLPLLISAYNNETVIFDGLHTYPNIGMEVGLLHINQSQSYVYLYGITVNNSLQGGIYLNGQYCKASNCKVNYSMVGGIHACGHYTIIEDCVSFQSAYRNVGYPGNVTWAAGIFTGRSTSVDGSGRYATIGGIIRRCKCSQTWGEGISFFEATNCTIEDCESYDNLSVDIYCSNADNWVCQRNLVYSTAYSLNTNTVGMYPCAGYVLSNETSVYPPGGPASPQCNNGKFINNTAVNVAQSIGFYHEVAGSNTCTNILIANNTFYNTVKPLRYGRMPKIISFPNANYTGSRFTGNICVQDDAASVLDEVGTGGMAFDHNIWSRTPSSAATGTGDYVGNPNLIASGWNGSPLTLTKEYFRPQAGSPVLSKAVVLAAVPDDLERVTRSNIAPTAGALETPVGGSGVTDWLTTIAPFSSANIGDTWAPGTFHKSPTTGQYRIVASGGTDIFNSADGMSALYVNLGGDFDLKCRIVQFNSTVEYAKIGLDVRETLDAGSAHYSIVKMMNGLDVTGLSRVTTNGTATFNFLAGTGANNWLRARKIGSSLEFMYGPDGNTWTTESTKTITGWPDSVYACLVACSKSATLTATAIFDSVSLVQSLPYPWVAADIGTVGLVGSSQYASGVYTVNGAGGDIWGTADAFQYVYRQYTGDFDVKARIPTGPTPLTHNYAKAGIMARGSLAENAANVIVTLLPTGNAESVYRPTDGGDSFLRERVIDASRWVRMVRQGNVFKTYYSSDGATWSALGTDLTLTLPSTLYLGMAVCSHTTAALTSATFDNISIGAVSSNVSQMFLLDM